MSWTGRSVNEICFKALPTGEVKRKLCLDVRAWSRRNPDNILFIRGSFHGMNFLARTLIVRGLGLGWSWQGLLVWVWLYADSVTLLLWRVSVLDSFHCDSKLSCTALCTDLLFSYPCVAQHPLLQECPLESKSLWRQWAKAQKLVSCCLLAIYSPDEKKIITCFRQDSFFFHCTTRLFQKLL